MTDWQRLETVIKYFGLSTNAFAASLGHKRAESLYRIERGENGISKKLAKDITIKYCNISETFLLTGEGLMLKPEYNNEVNKPTQLYACRECKKKDSKIEQLEIEVKELTKKYIGLLEELKDKKVS